jgi:hypothetical protein
MSLLVTIVKTRQSVAIGMFVGLIAAHLVEPVFERVMRNSGKSSEFAPLATLRLVITPLEVTKPSPASTINSPVGNISAVPTARQVVDLSVSKTQESPAVAAKSANNSKCFDDLLSLSLGEDEPSSKERARKPKC